MLTRLMAKATPESKHDIPPREPMTPACSSLDKSVNFFSIMITSLQLLKIRACVPLNNVGARVTLLNGETILHFVEHFLADSLHVEDIFNLGKFADLGAIFHDPRRDCRANSGN